jgi:tripartite-type tricarboxylate transporter receptor subunit TctC
MGIPRPGKGFRGRRNALVGWCRKIGFWEGTMKFLYRRQLLHLAAGASALPLVSQLARAQVYPTRPVRVVVGFPPGQTADIITRLVAQWLSERLGQPFVIDNRPGASSNIATEFVVRARPDGYTLLATVTSNFINATLYDNLTYDFIRDIQPVASINTTPLVMEVNPSFPENRPRVHRLR